MCTNSCKKIILLLILFLCFANVFAQDSDTVESAEDPEIVEEQDFGYSQYSPLIELPDTERPALTISAYPKYAPLIALSEGIAINAFVFLFDKFILNAPYAQVSFNDIRNNFKNGFVWDNDIFSTNAFFIRITAACILIRRAQTV